MVIGHSGIKWDVPILFNMINLFHMPLFIFTAGYCFKWNYIDDVRNFIKKRVLGLWWPYVKYGLLFLVLHNVFFFLNIYNDSYGAVGSTAVSYLYDYSIFCKKIINLLILSETEQLLGGFWFLKSLFWGSIFAVISIKYLRRFIVFLSQTSIVLVCGALFLLLSVLFSLLAVKIPVVGIGSREFLTSFFFLFGILFRKREFAKGNFFSIIFFIVVFGGALVFNETVSMLNYDAWQVFPYIIFACIGIIMIMNVSDALVKSNSLIKNFLTFTGCNTLDILTWHFLCFKIISFIRIVCDGRSIVELAYFPVIPDAKFWSMGYIFVGVAIPLFFAKIKKICVRK